MVPGRAAVVLMILVYVPMVRRERGYQAVLFFGRSIILLLSCARIMWCDVICDGDDNRLTHHDVVWCSVLLLLLCRCVGGGFRRPLLAATTDRQETGMDETEVVQVCGWSAARNSTGRKNWLIIQEEEDDDWQKGIIISHTGIVNIHKFFYWFIKISIWRTFF